MLLLTLCPTLGKRFGNTTFAHWPPGPWAAPSPAGRLEVDLRLDAMLGIAIFDIRLKNGASLVSFSIPSVFGGFHRRRRPPSPEKCHLGERDATDHPISRRERRREFSPQPEKWGAGWQLRRLRQDPDAEANQRPDHPKTASRNVCERASDSSCAGTK
jgi:hypothetical protein